MTFWCFPPDSKCEWDDLRSFVEQYNRTYGKSYYRSACLDVESRNASEPELLLEAPNECPIVIERKSVVWPPKYFSDHRNEHDLLGSFTKQLRSRGDPFSDGAYQLEVRESSLKGRKKREVEKLAEQIADVVLSDHVTAKAPGGIGEEEPIHWGFRPIPPQERDGSVPTRGIHIAVSDDADLPEMLRSVGMAKSGYAQEFQRSAMAAAEKFKKYSHCQTLLLVQFCGQGVLGDEDIGAIVQSAQLPEVIDQVWVARKEWVNAWDYQIAWEPAR